MWPPPPANRPLGIGCMRLSTDPDRDDDRAVAVLHAALDAGVTLLDTADAYGLDAGDVGHNERLIARALASWAGDRSRIVVATKGGLTRPEGRWVADGRARHLAAACDASRRALGVDRIALYQLHAVDPRTPFETSVRALAALRDRGAVAAVGLCNVTVGQIETARRLVDVAAVQVELSLWHDAPLLDGVAAYCAAHGIPLLAYRPLGGTRRRRRALADPVLAAVAAKHRATPFEAALAWLRDLSPVVVPLPGPTRGETARSGARAHAIRLDDEDRARFDERVTSARSLRGGDSEPVRRSPAAATHREVVVIMGLPGAGKSTLAAEYEARGHLRLNRDEAGGALRDLVPALDAALASGAPRVVLDNTYVSRLARAPVLQAAARHGVPVRCVWLTTSVEDAQVNAVTRMIERHGRLLEPDEIRAAARRDPGILPPTVQTRYQREMEPPTESEGFARIDTVPFERRRDPSRTSRAVIVWCDGILWQSRAGHRAPVSAEDVAVRAERGDRLRRYQAEGWHIVGLSWQPGLDDGTIDRRGVDGAIARLRDGLGLSVEFHYCPHAAGPPRCWCRKPLPGLGVLLAHRHGLDPAACVYVGAGPQDPPFARRLGFDYRDADVFFAG